MPLEGGLKPQRRKNTFFVCIEASRSKTSEKEEPILRDGARISCEEVGIEQ